MKPSTIFIFACIIVSGVIGLNTNNIKASNKIPVFSITGVNQSASDLATLKSDIAKVKAGLPEWIGEGYLWIDAYITSTSVVYEYSIDEDLYDMAAMNTPQAKQMMINAELPNIKKGKVAFQYFVRCKKNFTKILKGTYGSKVTVVIPYSLIAQQIY